MGFSFRQILRFSPVFLLLCFPAFGQWRAASGAASHSQSRYSAAPTYANQGSYVEGNGGLVFGNSGLDISPNSPPPIRGGPIPDPAKIPAKPVAT